MRVAVIGTGNIGRKHLRLLSAEPEVELAAVVSTREENAVAAAEQWGGRPYTSLRELLSKEDIDAAWVCVPPAAHGPIEHTLIEHGVPFFVEKPLSADRQTAEGIGAALRACGLIAGVGYHWRAMDTIPEVRRALADNPPRMVLGAWYDKVPPPPWWIYRALSGGQIVEQATHLFDIARVLVGEARVVAAAATRFGRTAYPEADIAEASAVLLRYASGATGIFTATSLLQGLVAAHVQFFCEGVMITLNERELIYDTGTERRRVPRTNDPTVDENRAFLRAVSLKDPSILFCTYEDALLTHRLCFDASEAELVG